MPSTACRTEPRSRSLARRPFDQLKIGNYSDFTFNFDAAGTDKTLPGGNSFKIFGIESKISTVTTVTEVFRVSHDESAGVNNTPDPNAADDTADVRRRSSPKPGRSDTRSPQSAP